MLLVWSFIVIPKDDLTDSETFALLGYMQRRLVVIYRRFGTIYQFRLQGSNTLA